MSLVIKLLVSWSVKTIRQRLARRQPSLMDNLRIIAAHLRQRLLAGA